MTARTRSSLLQVASFGSLLYFAFYEIPVLTPLIPPPPRGGGDDGGASELATGLYSVSPWCHPDARRRDRQRSPRRDAVCALLLGLPRHSITRASRSLAVQVPETEEPITFGASAATGTLYYKPSPGCYYRQ